MLCVMLIFATIWQKWQKWSRISRKTLSKTAHFSIFGGIPEIEFYDSLNTTFKDLE